MHQKIKMKSDEIAKIKIPITELSLDSILLCPLFLTLDAQDTIMKKICKLANWEISSMFADILNIWAVKLPIGALFLHIF